MFMFEYDDVFQKIIRSSMRNLAGTSLTVDNFRFNRTYVETQMHSMLRKRLGGKSYLTLIYLVIIQALCSLVIIEALFYLVIIQALLYLVISQALFYLVIIEALFYLVIIQVSRIQHHVMLFQIYPKEECLKCPNLKFL